MKVKFIPTKDHKFVEIFVDGAHLMTRDVSTDNDGHEFIYVPNLLRPEGDIVEKYSFLHRVGDMVTHIRNGWGDAINVSHLIVRTEHLYWFLDREYGEELRKKSIQGWKNTEFAWAVFLRNNIFGDEPLNVHGETRPILVEKTDKDASWFQTRFYETEKAAQAFIDGVLDYLRPLAAGYRAIRDTPENEGKLKAYYEEHLESLKGVYESVWLLSGDKDPDNDCALYVGQIIQKNSAPYTDRTIYRAKTYDDPEYYMCKGDAIDRLDDIHCDVVTDEAVLRLQIPESELFTGRYEEKREIYRLATQESGGKWYLSIDECFDGDYNDLKREAEMIGCQVKVETRTLFPQKLQPIVPSEEQPYMMLLSPGDRGLVGRANLRPDEVGKYSGKKKVYFPDRSCKDSLCAGMAKVTGVNDRGNYGFITGTMVQYTQPTEEDLAKFLITEHMFYGQLEFITNKYWGAAVASHGTDPNSSWRYIAVDETGELKEYDILGEYDHRDDVISESISAADFICTGYTGQTQLGLLQAVPRIPDLWRYPMSESIKFISEDFDEAIQCGFIKLWRLYTFDLVEIVPDRVFNAAEVLQKDLIPVLEEAKKINEAAIAAITNLKRKGKL